jgi:hypothetical protein
MFPEHDVIKFLPSKSAPKGFCILGIKSEIPDEVFNFICEFCDDNFKRVSKDISQWYVKSDECEAILNTIDENLEQPEEEDAEQSDDELIQEALARRFKSESSGKTIEDETLPDSEDEDVVSMGRRMRHLYTRIGELTKRVSELEKGKK